MAEAVTIAKTGKRSGVIAIGCSRGRVSQKKQLSIAANMDVLVAVKLYCLVIVFVATMVAGLSPYFMRWSHVFLTLGIQFAGGVFLSTAMLHFLGDSNNAFKELTSTSYPIAFMLAVCGYLLTLIGDETVHYVHDKSRQQQLASSSFDCKEGPLDNSDSAGVCKSNSESLKATSVSATDPEFGSKNLAATKGTTGVLSSNANFADAILLVLALCFHSVFEGLAIGIADTAHDAWRNMWTVMLHKVLAAISMSIALLRILPSRPFFSVASYAFGFAASSPVGIAIGIIIDSLASDRAANWTYAIAMGVASGVFWFVAINHLLKKGYSPPQKLAVDTAFCKTMAIIAGASFIFVAMYFDG